MNRRIARTRVFPAAAALALCASLAGCAGASGAGQQKAERAAKPRQEYKYVDSNPVSAPDLGDMRAVAENDSLVLYLRDETAETAVLVKSSGRVWHSNPPDADTDPVASPEAVQQLRSQLFLTYYDSSATLFPLNSRAESVEKENFTVAAVENGVKITYRFEKESTRYLIPEAVSEARMDGFCANMDADDADELKTRRYRYYAPGEQVETADGDAPRPADHGVYILRPTNNESVKETISETFAGAGYTEADLQFDRKENGIKTESSKNYQFVIPVIYKLEGDDFLAFIPGSEIEYNKSFPISTVSLLPFFGAAREKTEGYLFVPDGSGALIHFDSRKPNVRDYAAPVYGLDHSIRRAEKSTDGTPVTMPVFGSSQGDRGFFAVIEGGESFAAVETGVSGRAHSYNTAYTTFEVLPATNLALGQLLNTQDKLMAFAPKIHAGRFGVRYGFLESDASYSAMARRYRGYLEERGVLRPAEEKNPPFIVETVGAINKRKTLLGVPYDGRVTLTNFEETRKIAERILKAGVEAPVLRLSGWMNGGMNQTVSAKTSVLSELGGRGGLAALSASLRGQGVRLYPDVSFSYSYGGGALSGFSPRKQAARGLDNTVMKKYGYHLVTNRTDADAERIAPYVVSPAQYPAYAKAFAKTGERYGFAGVSVGLLGGELSSDHIKTAPVTRQDAAELSAGALAALRQNGRGVLGENSGAFAWGGVDYIVNLPQTSNLRYACDESVPFAQMVLHGSVSYTGLPLNLSGDIQTGLLRAAETGSGVYAKWIYRDNSLVENSYYNDLYALQINDSFDRVVAAYKALLSPLANLNAVKIQSHRRLSPQVTETVYENGARVLVNYGGAAYEADGATVAPGSFSVVGKDGR